MNITIVALGSSGDVYPTLALGLGLKKAGARVCLAAHPLFENDIRNRGVEFSPIHTLLRQSLALSPNSLYPARTLDPFRFLGLKKGHITPIMESIVKDIRSACQDADLILYNMLGLPAHYFAKQMGIKACPICLQPLGRTKGFPSPVISSSIPVPKMFNVASYWVVEKCMNMFLRNSGQLKGRQSFQNLIQELYSQNIPVLHGFSSRVLPKPSDWSKSMHITGYWFLDTPRDWEPPSDLGAFLQKGSAPVCVGFGSMNDPDITGIVRKAVQGVLQAGHRVILLTGWSEQAFKDLASPDLYVANSIPHDWLFPKVSAVVHHGGAGTTAAAIKAGVPSVIIPFFFDQGFWADRLEKLGAGPPLLSKKALNPGAMAVRINKALDDSSIHEKLEWLCCQVNKENGVENAVNLLLA